MSDPQDPPHQAPAAPATTGGRRDFLIRLGIGAGGVAIGAQSAASLRSLVPNVSYDAPTTVKLGLPGDFPDGLKFLPDERLFVFREGKTFHAISAVCTHLGCTVRAEALSQPQEAEIGGKQTRLTHKFGCPCHGSHYNGDGSNIEELRRIVEALLRAPTTSAACVYVQAECADVNGIIRLEELNVEGRAHGSLF